MLRIKSWYVNAALIIRQKSQSKSTFWVGKYEEVKDYPVTTKYMWTQGGQDIQEDCVVTDESEGWKLKRVSCSSTATYFCEPKPPRCPTGYSFIPAIGDTSCFKLSDFAMETQTIGKLNISSILTANKMCLEDGTRLATPLLNDHRNALGSFAIKMDQIQFGDGKRTLEFYTGLMYFDQNSIVPASCPTCAALPSWQSGWITPFSDELTPASSMSNLPSDADNCVAIMYNITTGNVFWKNKECVEHKNDKHLATLTMCEHKRCDGCIFPFIYGGRKYDTCVTHGTTDGSSWCSTALDENGYHIEGSSQACPTDCPKNDCPVGFRKHLKTCLQESASSRNDNPDSVAKAEEECLFQGGRLYQPRSTRSLNAASVVLPRVFNGSVPSSTASSWGVHNWARETSSITEETAIGMFYNNTQQPPELYYNDGSKVPTGLINAKLNWHTAGGFPTMVDSETCITLQILDKLSNADCEKYTNKSVLALSYICEARSFITTVDGPLENPGKACVFPFKIEAGGEWQHSCQYDPLPENKWNVWCATQVDGSGVMVPDAKGNCDDERNTAYDGPDADNTCKLPFFWDGRWYENCTLYPKDDFWCATNVDPVTREMVDG